MGIGTVVSFSNLKHRFQQRELMIAGWMSEYHTGIAYHLGQSGIDWLVADMEHGLFSDRDLLNLCQTVAGSGTNVLVRTNDHDGEKIKRCLDLGAAGVIAPMVCSGVQAEKIVAATRYQPSGTRGVGFGYANGFGSRFSEYMDEVENLVTVVMIEHITAVSNLEEILSVDGVDGVFVGPYDLSASMGIPGKFTSSKFETALEKILDSCRRFNKSVGYHQVEPDVNQMINRFESGCNFVAFGTDYSLVQSSIAPALAVMKSSMKQERG